jgi:hypothetical protein
MSVLPNNSAQPTTVEEFLDVLARRLGTLQKGGRPDLQRAERWFIHWWRKGGAVSTPAPFGWGLDFDFTSQLDSSAQPSDEEEIQKLMGYVVDDYVSSLHGAHESDRVSLRQEKKAARETKIKAWTHRR